MLGSYFPVLSWWAKKNFIIRLLQHQNESKFVIPHRRKPAILKAVYAESFTLGIQHLDLMKTRLPSINKGLVGCYVELSQVVSKSFSSKWIESQPCNEITRQSILGSDRCDSKWNALKMTDWLTADIIADCLLTDCWLTNCWLTADWLLTDWVLI